MCIVCIWAWQLTGVQIKTGLPKINILNPLSCGNSSEDFSFPKTISSRERTRREGNYKENLQCSLNQHGARRKNLWKFSLKYDHNGLLIKKRGAVESSRLQHPPTHLGRIMCKENNKVDVLNCLIIRGLHLGMVTIQTREILVQKHLKMEGITSVINQ